jgi:hypothetical protein
VTTTLEQPQQKPYVSIHAHKPRMRFKVLAGQHIEPDESLPPDTVTGLHPVRIYYTGHIVETWRDLEFKFNGGTPDTRKFERIYDDAPTIPGATEEEVRQFMEWKKAQAANLAPSQPNGITTVANQGKSEVQKAAEKGFNPATSNTPQPLNQPTLDIMSVKELQDFAKEEEIDIRGAKTKEDLLRVIKAAL